MGGTKLYYTHKETNFNLFFKKKKRKKSTNQFRSSQITVESSTTIKDKG